MRNTLLIAPSVEIGRKIADHWDDQLRDQVCICEEASPACEPMVPAAGSGTTSVPVTTGPTPARAVHENGPCQIRTVVVLPRGDRRNSCMPDVEQTTRMLKELSQSSIHLILVSSAAACGAHHHNTGLLTEEDGQTIKDENSLATSWRAIEAEAKLLSADSSSTVTILRPCSVHGVDAPVNVLTRGRVRRSFGHNPTVQLLSIDDFAAAIAAAIRHPCAGTFNLAPRITALLSEVQHACGAGRIDRTPGARTSQSWLSQLLFRLLRFSRPERDPAANSGIARSDLPSFTKREPGKTFPKSYAKYSWTVSGVKAATELDFRPKRSTLEALGSTTTSEADEFGLSPSLIRSFGGHILRFMEKFYWRIEVRGLENIPGDGKMVLAGPHRGFMPFDGVMLVHLLTKYTSRTPRFLIHPCLIKFMFLAKFISRFGGMIACQKNADRVLESNEILGIFPDGIHGAFTMYRDAYQTSRFWRDDFAAMAIRHDAPIVPFAVVGSADMYPIVGKVKWRWWKKLTEWPFFPVTVPFPLPTKWHIEFLPAISPACSSDSTAVEHTQAKRVINQLVQTAVQASVTRMVECRRSRFFGSAFPPANPATSGVSSAPDAALPALEKQVV